MHEDLFVHRTHPNMKSPHELKRQKKKNFIKYLVVATYYFTVKLTTGEKKSDLQDDLIDMTMIAQ